MPHPLQVAISIIAVVAGALGLGFFVATIIRAICG